MSRMSLNNTVGIHYYVTGLHNDNIFTWTHKYKIRYRITDKLRNSIDRGTLNYSCDCLWFSGPVKIEVNLLYLVKTLLKVSN